MDMKVIVETIKRIIFECKQEESKKYIMEIISKGYEFKRTGPKIIGVGQYDFKIFQATADKIVDRRYEELTEC